ncbi:MAG: hypothetical protein KGJ13_02145 [Patescibacteria group bacterium]|nr:hypothetical protein [Patescibacteria group bacterium]
MNDQGDDTQTSGGAANAQYFFADADIAVALSAAQNSIFSTLVDTNKLNELKNLMATATSSPLPSNFFKPLSAQVTVGGVAAKAMVFDDPSNQAYLTNTTLYAVNIYGSVVVTTPAASTFSILYISTPTDFTVGDATDHQEFTESFYEAMLSMAEFYLVYKDAAQVRTVMRRKFGEEDIQMFPVYGYLQGAR